MKYRKDFVTNSSSSSFVCEICGDAQEVYDGEFFDSGLCECPKGHIFESCYKLKDDVSLNTLKKEILENTSISDEYKEDIAELTSVEDIQDYIVENDVYCDCDFNSFSSECPICTMKSISNTSRKRFMGLLFESESNIDNFIKTKFKTLDDFESFMNDSSKEKFYETLKELTKEVYHEV